MQWWRSGAGCVLAGLLAGCSSPSYPGNVLIGTFGINATLVDGGNLLLTDGGLSSELIENTDGGFFSFSAILSMQSPAPVGFSFFPAWVTVQGTSTDAGFNGQILTSLVQAPRTFDSCVCDEGMEVTESVTLAVLSDSQTSALNGVCPANILDGGIPSGPGISPPGPMGSLYDALLVCGLLVDEISPLPDAGCTCVSGFDEFTLSGNRQ